MKRRTKKYKHQKIQQCKDNSGEENDCDDDDYNDNDSSMLKSGVGEPINDSTSSFGVSEL